MSIAHDTISLERHYHATPERVFGAFSNPAAKAIWFHGPDHWPAPEGWTSDFRIGGIDTVAMGPAGGEPYYSTARYYDIVPNRRIVLSYEMVHAGRRISISMQSYEMVAEDGGTRLSLTDQGAYLDDLDVPANRRRGLEAELDQLAQALTTLS